MTDEHKQSWDQPESVGFKEWMDSRVALLDTREYDWNALKFQADYDPKYRRAQMRYVGTGAAGVSDDGNSVPAGNFTLSTMILPAHSEGPLHIHMDVEEIFFVLRGRDIKMIGREDGGDEQEWESVVGERDLISWPPGVWRGVQNLSDEDALMLVMLGASKPEIPSYPPSSPLAKIKRELGR